MVPPLSSFLLFYYDYLNLFGQSGISSTNWMEQPEFCKGLRHWDIFLFGQQDQVATRQVGVWIYFHFHDFFDPVRVFSPNPILIIKVLEYSMISVLEYFGDTLENIGLPKAWLECD